jgi:phosphate starvation-inducible protein PhoH
LRNIPSNNDPYLRPLYDALYEMLGFERAEKLIERKIIEVAPLAFMRGRTLNDSFIILDIILTNIFDMRILHR